MKESRIARKNKNWFKRNVFSVLKSQGIRLTNISFRNGEMFRYFGENSVLRFSVKDLPFYTFEVWNVDGKEIFYISDLEIYPYSSGKGRFRSYYADINQMIEGIKKLQSSQAETLKELKEVLNLQDMDINSKEFLNEVNNILACRRSIFFDSYEKRHEHHESISLVVEELSTLDDVELIWVSKQEYRESPLPVIHVVLKDKPSDEYIKEKLEPITSKYQGALWDYSNVKNDKSDMVLYSKSDRMEENKMLYNLCFPHPDDYDTESEARYPSELFGVECDRGWYKLIRYALLKIAAYNKKLKRGQEPIKVLQIKEKWGLLNIYTNYTTDKIWKVIELMENESCKVCEYCGSREDVGTITRGWIKTLCKTCVQDVVDGTDRVIYWTPNSGEFYGKKFEFHSGEEPKLVINKD